MTKPTHDIPADWIADFEAAARRPLELHVRYSFVKTNRPVMDDASFRSFDTLEDYRQWCEAELPAWLGYSRAAPDEGPDGDPTERS